MTMGSMSVRPEVVRMHAEEVRNGAKAIVQKLETLDSEVSKLRSAWDGGAQEAYDAAQLAWTKQLNEMNNLLDRIANETIKISENYQGNDRHSAQRFV